MRRHSLHTSSASSVAAMAFRLASNWCAYALFVSGSRLSESITTNDWSFCWITKATGSWIFSFTIILSNGRSKYHTLLSLSSKRITRDSTGSWTIASSSSFALCIEVSCSCSSDDESAAPASCKASKHFTHQEKLKHAMGRMVCRRETQLIDRWDSIRYK